MVLAFGACNDFFITFDGRVPVTVLRCHYAQPLAFLNDV